MGSVIASGIGSGLDIDGLVTKLVQAEGTAKAANLSTREAGFTAKLSAFGSFRSSLAALQTALTPLKDLTKFQGRGATSGDPKVFTVTAQTNAAIGSYDIEVERLATAHKVTSGPYAAAATVGSGSLQIAVGAASFSVTIDSGAATLADIRNAINTATNNVGVTASIVNESGVGARLILTSNKTGAANQIVVTPTGDAGLTSFAAGFAGTAAVDSRIVVNGFVHESASNAVTTAIEGVTFNLIAPSATDVTAVATVSYDKTAATKAVNDFVTAYNTLVTSLKGLNAYDATTKTGGPLLGDSTLRDFMTNVRRELSTAVTGVSKNFSSLTDIGITAQLDGTLQVNASRLDGFMTSSFDQVGGLFANKSSTAAPVDGVARRLDKLVDTYIKSGGLIEARTQGLQTSITSIKDQREALSTRLDALEKRLRAQFTAMDSLVAQLNSTGNFLTQQISTLNGSVFTSNRR